MRKPQRQPSWMTSKSPVGRKRTTHKKYVVSAFRQTMPGRLKPDTTQDSREELKDHDRADRRAVGNSLERFCRAFDRKRRRDQRRRIKEPALDQPHISRQVAHDLQSTLLSRMNR